MNEFKKLEDDAVIALSHDDWFVYKMTLIRNREIPEYIRVMKVRCQNVK